MQQLRLVAVAAVVFGVFAFVGNRPASAQPCPPGVTVGLDGGCGGPMEDPPSPNLPARMDPASDVNLNLQYDDSGDGITLTGETPTTVFVGFDTVRATYRAFEGAFPISRSSV